MSETTGGPADETGDSRTRVPGSAEPDREAVPRAPSDPADPPADPGEPLNPA